MTNRDLRVRLLLTCAATMIGLSAQQAWAQTQPAAAADSDPDIIVTARRSAEGLQNVPLTVNALGGESLAKLNIQKFEDIQTAIPGLQLGVVPQGYGFTITLRGASYDSNGGGDPTVETYLNDAFVPGFFFFQSMYDVGQVEVLRGPQGTLRGRASPSGSITLTSRRPDLDEVGGNIYVTGTDRHGFNGSAAINIPLVPGKVALRLAGLNDENDSDFVRSVSSTVTPRQTSRSGRISLRVEPTDWFSGNVMYQVVNHKNTTFQGVESIQLSQPGYPLSNIGTGPVIRASDRLGITDQYISLNETQKILNLQAEIRLAGQKFNYVGSHADWQGYTNSPQDPANVLRPGDVDQPNHTDYRDWSHEFRLSSEERVLDMLDYTVGYFRDRRTATNSLLLSNVLPASTNQKRSEDSYFGNLTAHIGNSTEIAAGVRHIKFSSSPNDFSIPGFGVYVNYPTKYDATIYNASISHHINDNLMVYANTGSSWRAGFFAISILRSITPNLDSFLNLKPETSKSYEIGLKSSLMDKKIRLNLAYFHQDYKNFQYRAGSGVNYINITAPTTSNPTGEVLAQNAFFANVPAKVDGVEAELFFKPSERFSLEGDFAWSKGMMKNGRIACNDSNGDGVPDNGTTSVSNIKAISGNDAVAACTVTMRINKAPDWSVTLQPEYNVPVSGNTNAFIRGLLSYNPTSQNDPMNAFDDVSGYEMVNLYLGLRDAANAWELSVWAKNLTNVGRTLGRDSIPVTSFGVNDPTYGLYVNTRYSRPREFGVSLRYAFGSR